MKINDLKNYEIGSHCFGEILNLNEKTLKQYNKSEIKELINDIIDNNENDNLINEILPICLEHLNFELEEEDQYECDQCGDHNHYEKYVKKQ